MSEKVDGPPVDSGRSCARHCTAKDATGGAAANLRRLLRCNRGAVAVEFGLAAPVLLAVLVPVADLGIAFSQQQQLRQAVQAGAQYATSHAWNQNSPNAIAAAITGATTLSGVTVSPSPYQQCGCPSSSGITTTQCSGNCVNGDTLGYYVFITARLPYTPILPYTLLGSSTVLTAQSIVRIR